MYQTEWAAYAQQQEALQRRKQAKARRRLNLEPKPESSAVGSSHWGSGTAAVWDMPGTEMYHATPEQLAERVMQRRAAKEAEEARVRKCNKALKRGVREAEVAVRAREAELKRNAKLEQLEFEETVAKQQIARAEAEVARLRENALLRLRKADAEVAVRRAYEEAEMRAVEEQRQAEETIEANAQARAEADAARLRENTAYRARKLERAREVRRAYEEAEVRALEEEWQSHEAMEASAQARAEAVAARLRENTANKRRTQDAATSYNAAYMQHTSPELARMLKRSSQSGVRRRTLAPSASAPSVLQLPPLPGARAWR